MTAWKLVPVEPTEKMLRAHYSMSPKYESWDDSCRRQYATILAAAPAPDDALVERMARAIWESFRGGSPMAEQDWIDGGRVLSERLARAALAALQENGDG